MRRSPEAALLFCVCIAPGPWFGFLLTSSDANKYFDIQIRFLKAQKTKEKKIIFKPILWFWRSDMFLITLTDETIKAGLESV